MEDCIEIAMKMRLDLNTENDKVLDAMRDLRVARNAMLPNLTLKGSAELQASGEDKFPSDDSEHGFTAGAELELPLDKRNERDAVTRATIALQRARRSAEQKRDEIQVQIIESFQLLKTQEQTVSIEERNTEIAKRRAEYAVLEFKSGNFSNRDVVEAQDEQLNAENSYINALASYETRRIQLLRDIGVLDVTAEGVLVELPEKTDPETRSDDD